MKKKTNIFPQTSWCRGSSLTLPRVGVQTASVGVQKWLSVTTGGEPVDSVGAPQRAQVEELVPVLVPALGSFPREQVCTLIVDPGGPIHHEGYVLLEAQVHAFDGQGLKLWDFGAAW